MFTKKNDPLLDSVQSVIKKNDLRRELEMTLNEELGITSKKALPHEYHEAYDLALEDSINEVSSKLLDQAGQKAFQKLNDLHMANDGGSNMKSAIKELDRQTILFTNATHAKRKKEQRAAVDSLSDAKKRRIGIKEESPDTDLVPLPGKSKLNNVGISDSPPSSGTTSSFTRPAANLDKPSLDSKVHSIQKGAPNGKLDEGKLKDFVKNLVSKKKEGKASEDNHEGNYIKAQSETDLRKEEVSNKFSRAAALNKKKS